MQLLSSKFVIINIKNKFKMRLNNVYKSSLLLISIVLVLSSCDPFFNCLDGNGILKQEERFVTSFYAIENTTEVDVEITSDSVYFLEVIADENLLGVIETSVRDNKLLITMDNDRCIKTDNIMLVNIHMPHLESVLLSGSGNIDVYDFDCTSMQIVNSGSGKIDVVNLFSTNKVELELYGSGSIYVWGKARYGEYILSGSGDMVADDLKVDECVVWNSGSGNIYCFAYDYLTATLSGSGDIIYSGDPEFRVPPVDNGSGEIRSRTY
jgi:hypothetical protein